MQFDALHPPVNIIYAFNAKPQSREVAKFLKNTTLSYEQGYTILA